MLTAEEMQQCRRAFLVFDRNSDGVIDLGELRASLIALGHPKPSDAALQVTLERMDKDRSGTIEFAEFLQVIEEQKSRTAGRGGEADTMQAFAALGGQADGGGAISVARLAATLASFELRVDLPRLLEGLGKEADGQLSYEELKALLAGTGGGSGAAAAAH